MRPKHKEAMEEQHALEIAYRDLFKTPLGEKILADLERLFNPDQLHDDTPHKMAIRVGQSNPIRYILRRIENGVDGKSVR